MLDERCAFDFKCDESELVLMGQSVNIKHFSWLKFIASTLNGTFWHYEAVTSVTPIDTAVMSESPSTKITVFRGLLPHWTDPKEPPSKRAPYSTILAQPFTHTVFA